MYKKPEELKTKEHINSQLDLHIKFFSEIFGLRVGDDRTYFSVFNEFFFFTKISNLKQENNLGQ